MRYPRHKLASQLSTIGFLFSLCKCSECQSRRPKLNACHRRERSRRERSHRYASLWCVVFCVRGARRDWKLARREVNDCLVCAFESTIMSVWKVLLRFSLFKGLRVQTLTRDRSRCAVKCHGFASETHVWEPISSHRVASWVSLTMCYMAWYIEISWRY